MKAGEQSTTARECERHPDGPSGAFNELFDCTCPLVPARSLTRAGRIEKALRGVLPFVGEAHNCSPLAPCKRCDREVDALAEAERALSLPADAQAEAFPEATPRGVRRGDTVEIPVLGERKVRQVRKPGVCDGWASWDGSHLKPPTHRLEVGDLYVETENDPYNAGGYGANRACLRCVGLVPALVPARPSVGFFRTIAFPLKADAVRITDASGELITHVTSAAFSNAADREHAALIVAAVNAWDGGAEVAALRAELANEEADHRETLAIEREQSAALRKRVATLEAALRELCELHRHHAGNADAFLNPAEHGITQALSEARAALGAA